MNEWQPIVESAWHLREHRQHRRTEVKGADEAAWLKEVYKIINKGNNKCQQLDILEVYAYPNSQLTEVAQKCGLRARRFTREDGDLSTWAGQIELLVQVMLFRPKHVWLSPECGPWSAWNRFNASRSVQGFERVSGKQQMSKVHLRLCNLIAKIQLSSNRHVHLENPWTSGIWHQSEIEELLRSTLSAQMDQCMFGLRHPETDEALRR